MTTTGITPHLSANFEPFAISVINANKGLDGLYAATLPAVLPDSVKATIALAFKVAAVATEHLL